MNLSTSQTGSSSCQCRTIEWRAKGNKERCEYNSLTVATCARRFFRGHYMGLSWGLNQKRSGTELTPTDMTDHGIKSAENIMANISGSGHPIFRAPSAFEREELRSKEGGKKSIHFNDSHENIELLLRTVIFANQLSIYGAIADLCNEVPKDLRAPGKLAAPDHLEKMEIPSDICIAENSTNAQERRNLVPEYE